MIRSRDASGKCRYLASWQARRYQHCQHQCAEPLATLDWRFMDDELKVVLALSLIAFIAAVIIALVKVINPAWML